MIVDKLCARCGKLMVQVEHNRKRCPECALIVHREQARQRQRDKKEELLKNSEKQVETGRKGNTINDINRLAAELGMSYGKYVAAVMPSPYSGEENEDYLPETCQKCGYIEVRDWKEDDGICPCCGAKMDGGDTP